MKLKAKNSIKYNGQLVKPGEPFECKSTEAKRLIGMGAAEVWTEPISDDDESDDDKKAPAKPAIPMQFSGVESMNPIIADTLVKNGVVTLDDIVDLGVEGLIKLRGIGKAASKKIYESADALLDDGGDEGDDSGIGNGDFSHLKDSDE